jgi:hypothetical protein
MSTMAEKPPLTRPRQMTRRKLHRKQHNVMLYLNERERTVLEQQVDRFGVEFTTYFRGLIWAIHNGQLNPSEQLFRD